MPAAALAPTTTRASVGRKALAALPRLVGVWIARARMRSELATLQDDQLRDAGLDRDAVLGEAGKPFWKA